MLLVRGEESVFPRLGLIWQGSGAVPMSRYRLSVPGANTIMARSMDLELERGASKPGQAVYKLAFPGLRACPDIHCAKMVWSDLGEAS